MFSWTGRKGRSARSFANDSSGRLQTNLDSSRVARLGDNSEIVSDTPRENNLACGLSVLLRELDHDRMVDDSSLRGDLSGVGRVEVSCGDERFEK